MIDTKDNYKDNLSHLSSFETAAGMRFLCQELRFTVSEIEKESETPEGENSSYFFGTGVFLFWLLMNRRWLERIPKPQYMKPDKKNRK